MNLDVPQPRLRQTNYAIFDFFLNFLRNLTSFLDHSCSQSKIEVGRVLIERIHPSISDQETFELRREGSSAKNCGSYVRYVLTGVRFSSKICLEGNRVNAGFMEKQKSGNERHVA